MTPDQPAGSDSYLDDYKLQIAPVSPECTFSGKLARFIVNRFHRGQCGIL